MNKPNYKSLALHKFRELAELTKEEYDEGKTYSFGDLIYSVLRKCPKPEGVSAHWITKITDEQFYIATENAVKEEQTEWI